MKQNEEALKKSKDITAFQSKKQLFDLINKDENEDVHPIIEDAF